MKLFTFGDITPLEDFTNSNDEFFSWGGAIFTTEAAARENVMEASAPVINIDNFHPGEEDLGQWLVNNFPEAKKAVRKHWGEVILSVTVYE